MSAAGFSRREHFDICRGKNVSTAFLERKKNNDNARLDAKRAFAQRRGRKYYFHNKTQFVPTARENVPTLEFRNRTKDCDKMREVLFCFLTRESDSGEKKKRVLRHETDLTSCTKKIASIYIYIYVTRLTLYLRDPFCLRSFVELSRSLENPSKCHDMLGRSMRTQSRFYQAFKPSDFGWGVFVHRKLACVMKLKIRKLSQIERSHSKRQSAENLHGNRQVCDSADSTFCPTKRKAITY